MLGVRAVTVVGARRRRSVRSEGSDSYLEVSMNLNRGKGRGNPWNIYL